MAEPGHSHSHSHSHAIDGARRSALWWAIGLNGGYFVVELVAGFAFGSLALVADAAHMASDVGALGIALIAISLSTRPASDRHTYGLRRAEVLGAQINAVVLIGAAVWIAIEAWRRAGTDPHIDGGGVVVVALIGLAINLVSAVILARSAGRNLNMRAAVWHMASDVLGSIAALAAGLAVVLWDATWVDLVASVIVAAIVAVAGWSLLREAMRVLLESVPRSVDAAAVTEALRGDAQVDAVHHLHIWSIGSENTALSAHVVLKDVTSVHDAQGVVARLKDALAHEFAIDHATLEVECHDCEAIDSPEPAHARTSPRHHA